ncbi:MAG: hypothetical protein ICV86_02510 [Microcoleus sp. T3-bin5]|nr:hypothetical protein [Microcoleus sp. T3-bin5]
MPIIQTGMYSKPKSNQPLLWKKGIIGNNIQEIDIAFGKFLYCIKEEILTLRMLISRSLQQI